MQCDCIDGPYEVEKVIIGPFAAVLQEEVTKTKKMLCDLLWYIDGHYHVFKKAQPIPPIIITSL